MSTTTPTPTRRVQLLDQNGQLLRHVTAEEAQHIMQSHRVSVHGSGGRVRSLRYLTADRGIPHAPMKLRSPGLGDPNRRESDWNPRGVWTFDRLRDPAPFRGVLQSITR